MKDVTEEYKYILDNINLDFKSSASGGYFDLRLRHDKVRLYDMITFRMMNTLNKLCIKIARGEIKIMEVNKDE